MPIYQNRIRRDARRKTGRVVGFCLALAAGIGWAGHAAAETCTEQVGALARTLDLSLETERDTSPPRSSVVKPPPMTSPSVIEPPPAGPGAMPTTPTIDGSEPLAKGSHGLDAAERLRAKALLDAALAEAARGDSEDCFRRLQEAKDIVRVESRPKR